MLPYRSSRILALLVCGSWVVGFAQTSPRASQPQYAQPPEDLANALVQMARASHTPLIAELVWPVPRIPKAEGVSLSADRLNEIVKQAPGYEWKMEGKAVHFYNRQLRRARFNFINLEFPRYVIPNDLSELKLWFPGQAEGLLEGYTGGGMTTGFGDSLLAREKLKTTTFEKVTPLEVLIHVANESPTFYTVLVFPDAAPTKREAENRVVWQWGSLNEKLKPLYVEPPASVHQ